MEQLTAFRASPPIVDLATSVQNVAEEIMAMINAPPTTQSSGSCGNVDCWPYRKTKAAARTATIVTINFSLQISIRLTG